MKPSQVPFTAFVLLCLLSWTAAWQLGLRGCFNCERSPTDQSNCEWAECRKPGGGPRLFQVKCTLPSGQSYGCVYRGNPHACTAYNNNGQERFYKSLAEKSGWRRPDGCSWWKVYSSSMCPNVVFEKANPTKGKKSPAPAWCDEFP